MKNIKYLLLAFIASFSLINSAHCQFTTHDVCDYENLNISNSGVHDAYRYASIGIGPIIFIPNIGIGYRERHAKFGWDTALSFSTIGYAHQLSAHIIGHYYLSPMRKNSAYLGLGLMGSGILINHKKQTGTTLSTDFVFGKELQSSDDKRHFIEIHVAVPTICMSFKHHHGMYFPLTYIKYGVSF